VSRKAARSPGASPGSHDPGKAQTFLCWRASSSPNRIHLGGKRAGRGLFAALAAVVLVCGFSALGAWQLQRLGWKLDLIARVHARVHAAPAPPPGPQDWSRVSAHANEYRRVRVAGVLQNDRETLVQAVTDLGPGYWVMTPLRTALGEEILINRGFVPPERAPAATRSPGLPAAPVTITGLLRISEPHGGFLRANQPSLGRWYSRDVAAIARARGQTEVAPYFIDADATPNPGGWPRGGLTVIHFHNSHLAYALVWFTLAGMTVLWSMRPALKALGARRRRKGASPAAGDGVPS
jgi:surfeit locus 1 family protein